jgi:hypothetical protein
MKNSNSYIKEVFATQCVINRVEYYDMCYEPEPRFYLLPVVQIEDRKMSILCTEHGKSYPIKLTANGGQASLRGVLEGMRKNGFSFRGDQ